MRGVSDDPWAIPAGHRRNGRKSGPRGDRSSSADMPTPPDAYRGTSTTPPSASSKRQHRPRSCTWSCPMFATPTRYMNGKRAVRRDDGDMSSTPTGVAVTVTRTAAGPKCVVVTLWAAARVCNRFRAARCPKAKLTVPPPALNKRRTMFSTEAAVRSSPSCSGSNRTPGKSSASLLAVVIGDSNAPDTQHSYELSATVIFQRIHTPAHLFRTAFCRRGERRVAAVIARCGALLVKKRDKWKEVRDLMIAAAF